MCQEKPQRDASLVRSANLGNVLLNRRVETQLAFVHREHDRRGEPNHFRYRSQVVERLGSHGGGIVLTKTAGSVDESFLVCEYAQQGSRCRSSGNGRVEKSSDSTPVEFGG